MENNDLYFKSFFTDDGIRYRSLRQKEADRYEYLGLKRSGKWFHAFIYTLDQALELGIEFRENWKEENPNIEKKYFGDYVFCQREDWLITDADDNGELWVMQTLWRNENRQFPHIRTATGTYSWLRNGYKAFDGIDLQTQYRMGTSKPYALTGFNNGILSPREKLLVTFIVSLIMEFGYYSRDIVRLAYRKAYTHSVPPTWQKIVDIMRSEKIMTEVAKKLAKKLESNEMQEDWVLTQLKSMGESDYEHDPKRRERVVRLVGAMNSMPTYEVQHIGSPNNPKQIEDAEVLDDLKALDE